ncbi:MAG: homoserine dehydrogenase [Planctomycetaceae bacterium]|nr:MAG: homoserine dehydrogenase [Planctomycetaceae bacterium]
MNNKDPLHIGLIGLGTVGTGVARLLREQADRLARRAGRPLNLKLVAVRQPHKPRALDFPPGTITTDPWQIIDHPEVDVVVELMGGIHPARELVLGALERGKDVVTANKALLCEHGEQLFQRARDLGRTIAFEAAVAGGIPIIAAVGQAMAANQILSMKAILNGTCNYILTEMTFKNQSYAQALTQAQALGYAEADPSLDVKGIDAAQKLCILAQLAFGRKVHVTDFPVTGITHLEASDITYARQLGYVIKLLACARLHKTKLELNVQPTLIKQNQPLAQIHGSYNAVMLEGDVVGTVWYSGRGAGQFPTASAVVADLIDLAIGRAQLTFPHLDLGNTPAPIELLPSEHTTSRFYLRLMVEDRPHVMADVTHVLGAAGISLASVIQPEVPESEGETDIPIVPLIIMTHRTSMGRMHAAEIELKNLDCVRQPMITLPAAD